VKLLFLVVLLPSVIYAEEVPLWEAGLGLALVNTPAYRGVDARRTFVFPFPYINYNGRVMKAEGNTVRGMLFYSDNIELNISAGGSTPGNSDDLETRRGMPDLDPAMEIGPTLNLMLAEQQGHKWKLGARFPARAVLSTDFSSVEYRGWLFNPHLNLDLRDSWPGPGWKWGFAIGPLFATARYHEYFYSVAPQYATLSRPAYTAEGGYSGMRFTTALSKRYNRLWLGGYVRYEAIDGAVFDDSPLVNSGHDFSAGFAIAWIFNQSSKKVEVQD